MCPVHPPPPPLWHLSSADAAATAAAAAWEPAKEVDPKPKSPVKAIKPRWSCLGAQFKAETNAVRQQNHFQELAGSGSGWQTGKTAFNSFRWPLCCSCMHWERKRGLFRSKQINLTKGNSNWKESKSCESLGILSSLFKDRNILYWVFIISC